METHTCHIVVRVKPALKEALERIATETDTSLSVVAREALVEYVKRS